MNLNELLFSASSGDAVSQYKLAVFYSKNRSQSYDIEEAVKWVKMSAEQGNSDAEKLLGKFYTKGEGVPKSLSDAVKWWLKAAERGDDSAQLLVGDCYDYGRGVPIDYQKAYEWYLKSASQDNTYAQYAIGNCYSAGRYVEKNYLEAIDWYMKSAEQGNSLAQLAVGICYLNGYGVPQDNARALYWSQKAAEQGDLKAKELVALLNAKEKKNWSESHKLWHEIADNNDTNAKYFIGVSYSQIMNNEAALFLSYVWFSIAANAGHKEAAIDRENVEKMMPVESINDAQDFINNWKPGRLTIDAMKIINVIGTSNYTKFLTYQKFLTIANQMKECPENKHLLEVIYCLFKPASITDNNEQKKAIEKIEEFAEYGNVLSQYMLAYIYEQGIIMPRNVSKSFLWAGIARKNGLNKAIEIQQKIIDDMSNVQLVAAATIIESWKPKSHIHPTG